MLTFLYWKDMMRIAEWSKTPYIEYGLGCAFSIITIPIDLILCPLELLGFIIFKIKEGKK